MSKDTQKQGGFMAWISANEKVLFVVLLAVLSFSFAFGPQVMSVLTPGGRAVGVGFDETVTAEELNRTRYLLPQIARLALRAGLIGGAGTPMPRRTLSFFPSDRPTDFYFFRAAAAREGITVSETELARARHKIWRRIHAEERAAKNLEALGITPDNPQFNTLVSGDAEELVKKLDAANVFDPDDWSLQIRRIGRAAGAQNLRADSFEELLRDALAVAKLEAYVTSGAQVSDKEVFEEYRSEEQRRRPEWIELESSEALDAAIQAGITDADRKAFYDENTELFASPARLRFEALRIPISSFTPAVEASLTEEDVAEEYKTTRNEYVRAGIRRDAAAFALLSPEQSAERDERTFQPLEEVRDQVRASAIQRKARAAMLDEAGKLARRLFPSVSPKPDELTLGGVAVSFEEILDENEQASLFKSGWVTKEDAEEKLGELHEALRFRLNNWFKKIDDEPSYQLDEREKKSLESPLYVRSTEDGPLKGQHVEVFFLRAFELRPAGTRPYDDALSEVDEKLLAARRVEALGASADVEVALVNEGKKTFDSLASSELEVSVANEKLATQLSAKHTTPLYLRKRAPLMVPKAAEPDAASPDVADPEKELAADEEEVHPSSTAIGSALFAIGEPGKVGVARDETNGRVYLVRFADKQLPDAARFEDVAQSYRFRLESTARDAAFDEWLRRTQEAAGLVQQTSAEDNAS